MIAGLLRRVLLYSHGVMRVSCLGKAEKNEIAAKKIMAKTFFLHLETLYFIPLPGIGAIMNKKSFDSLAEVP